MGKEEKPKMCENSPAPSCPPTVVLPCGDKGKGVCGKYPTCKENQCITETEGECCKLSCKDIKGSPSNAKISPGILNCALATRTAVPTRCVTPRAAFQASATVPFLRERSRSFAPRIAVTNANPRKSVISCVTT